MNSIRFAALAAVCTAAVFAAPARSQNYPFNTGDYVEVTEVTIDDGHGLDYAMFLARQWRDQEEFAKSQGWITSYEILQNSYKRPGEADLYLVVRSRSLPDGAEQTRRDDVVRAHTRMTDAQMEAGSGDRAKYRRVIGQSLMQELRFK